MTEPITEDDRSQSSVGKASDLPHLKTFDRVDVILPDPIDLPPMLPSFAKRGLCPIDLPRIILADDDASMCDYLQRLLSRSYQVEIAVDGVAAMAAIERQPPDLVVTDVMMPNLDGLELVRMLRARPETQDIPVILLSAHDSEEARIAGLEAGADDYIVKPFSSRELIARVDATLKLARLRLSARDRERALQQETDTARANLDRIVANLNNGFATFDRDWRYTYANNRLLEIFELPRERVLGKQAWEVFPHQVGIQFFDLLNRAMTERVEAQFEYYYEQIDCWVEHRVYPTDEGLAILMADVSERKRAELLSIEQTKLLELAAAELRESEIEYRALFESIDEGFCIVEMLFDEREQPVDYRFLQVNPAFFSLTGLPADAVGKTMRQMVPDLEDFWMEIYGNVLLTGAAARFENYSAPMNRWYDVYASKVGDGASRRIAIVFTNITERKQAEKISQRAAKFDAFRIALADTLRQLTSPIEIQVTASRMLGEFLGANRVMYFEIRGTDYVIDRDYVNGVRSMCGSYPIDSFGSTVLAALRNGQSLSIADVVSVPNFSPEQKAAYAAVQIGAYIVIPLLKGGEFSAGLTVHVSEPRSWTPDDLNLAAEVAERTWAAIERARAEVALQESEAKYRTLFESIDEGYILVEMLFDANDRPIDFRYLDANPAAVKLLGGNPIGQRTREVFPTLEGHWFETLGRVAQTGVGERDELDASSLGAWYNFYAFKIGDADSRRVAVIFEDVTARKRREANTAFLTAIQDDFAQLTTADEIVQAVGEKLGRYLDTSQCLFTEIDEAQDRAMVEYNWHRADTLDLVGTYQISEFVNAEFYRAVRARETIVVGNTQTDPRTNADRYAAFNVQAFVHVPFHRGNNWKFLLTVNDVRSRDWREDEVELIYEVANRLFPRIERARAEAEVAANLRDTQLLRELGARLVSEDDAQTLYREILAAAIELTGADAGSVQILDESTQDLCFIASQGIPLNLTERFARVDASSDTSCGMALCSGIRTFVDFDATHPDPNGSMRLHVEAGLLSAQSTPLISRTGKPIGMVSTHWRTRHRPSDSPKERLCQRQLQFLDLLARQAADTIEQRQTTAALRDREEQLRLATAASKLGLWFWNLETDTLTWTEQCKAIFGLPADVEMSYEVFQAALHPDDRQRTHAAVIRSMAERADYDIEYRSCWPDGTIHWIAAKGSCTYDATGTPIQMLGVAIDITERKRVEEALRASEAQLAAEVADMQQLQQISSQLICEDNIDALYAQIVDAAIALMDADLGTVYTLDPDRNELRLLASRGLHPTAVEHWQSVSLESNTASGKTAASGEPTFISDVESCNLPFGSVDLDCARLSGIRAVHSTPLISRTGRIVGTICTQWRTPHQPSVRRLRLLDVLARQVADLLDRKQAEESLRESQTRLQFMLDASEIGEWDLDLTTKPHTAHRSLRHDQIFGYESPLPDWSYEIFLTHVHPDDRTAIAANFLQTLVDNTPWNFECRIVHPDDSIHWIWVRSSVYCDSSGTPIRLLGMVVDFTDRKLAEATLAERAHQLADLNRRLAASEIQLQERNQELNSFVHIVSHDLKAPLRAVANLSQWIEEDFEGTVSATTTEQMNLLRGRIYRMEGMIDGLLEYARVGRQDSQLELVSVVDLLSEVIESIAPPPTFKLDIAAQMPTFAANRLLLSQVFANLISNAFKHHDRSDGCIRISSRELDNCYEFAICDDGPGIAPEYRDRVFVIFQSANPQQHPDSTGIGLSIVKKIVETAGGKIWLESELGKGTTFYFTWPNRSIDRMKKGG